MGVGSVVGEGGGGVEVGVLVGVAVDGAGGEGKVGTSVGPAVGERGGGVAVGTGSAVSASVGEPSGTAGGTTGVGLGCVGAQLDRDTVRIAANSARLKSFALLICLSLLLLKSKAVRLSLRDGLALA